MSPERWQQIKTILDAAADSPAAGREAVLDDACGEDAGLRQDVEVFLDLDDAVEDFIEEPLWSLNPGNDAEEDDAGTWGIGRRVGPYRIERPIGRGGMGTVFLAVRQDDYSQKVALKVLGWGMSSEEVLGRFYNERQILANLQHPAIARLLDGGTTDAGLPYLVMEYVEGERIDRYCERRDLPVRERLELFRQVCAAVQYAHQNLIVHRDLKASNILVNEHGKVRLLDFGIAKILESERAFQKVATLPGHAPMTPAYASPEQVLNDPITTACDVYALGVLLYRLLTGLPPYRLEGTSYPEMIQVICFREPEKPSTVVRLEVSAPEQETTQADESPAGASLPTSAVSRDRLRARGKKIAGDLDAIVLRAMRKEPQHRYASAAEMSEDIHRHLVGLPVAARKGNWIYHTGKFLRRNKLALAAILLILAFAVTATFLWRQAVRQRAAAERERERAEIQEARAVRVRTFLEELLSQADPDEAGGAEVTAEEILERGRAKIRGEDLETTPEDRAELLGTIGSVYYGWGWYQEAAESFAMALEVRRSSDPTDRPELAKDVNNLAQGLYGLRDYENAEPKFREAIAMWERLGHVDGAVATAKFNLAATLNQLGKLTESKRLYGEALALRTELYGPESSQVASILYGLGALYTDLGDFENAEQALRQALNIRIREHGPEHTSVAKVLNSLGRLLHVKGDLDEARDVLDRALAIRLERLGANNSRTVDTQKNLAALLLEQGQVERAGALIESVLQALEEAGVSSGQSLADAKGVRGRYLQARGRYREAEPYLLECFQFTRGNFGDGSFRTRRARDHVVEFYEAWSKHDEAARYRSPSQNPTR